MIDYSYYVSTYEDCAGVLFKIDAYLGYVQPHTHSFIAELDNGEWYMPFESKLTNIIGIDQAKVQSREYVEAHLKREEIQ